MPDTVEQLNEAEWDSLNPVAEEGTPTRPSYEPPEPNDSPDYMSMPAPYGRFKNGRPRKTPVGGKSTSTRSKKKDAPQYYDGIMGMFQIAGVGLMMAGGDKNKAFTADSAAIATYGPDVAKSLDLLAQERPEIAAVLDKLLAVGPYGLVIGAVVPLAMQIAANHGVKIPGTPNAEEFLAAVESEGKAA